MFVRTHTHTHIQNHLTVDSIGSSEISLAFFSSFISVYPLSVWLCNHPFSPLSTTWLHPLLLACPLSMTLRISMLSVSNTEPSMIYWFNNRTECSDKSWNGIRQLFYFFRIVRHAKYTSAVVASMPRHEFFYNWIPLFPIASAHQRLSHSFRCGLSLSHAHTQLCFSLYLFLGRSVAHRCIVALPCRSSQKKRNSSCGENVSSAIINVLRPYMWSKWQNTRPYWTWTVNHTHTHKTKVH